MNTNDLVYICSPLSAADHEQMKKNMIYAGSYARTVSICWGCRTIAPHSFLPRYLNDAIKEERETAISFGLSVLKLCKALVICGEQVSEGMRNEIGKAREWGIPVYRLIGERNPEIVPVKEANNLYEM